MLFLCILQISFYFHIEIVFPWTFLYRPGLNTLHVKSILSDNIHRMYECTCLVVCGKSEREAIALLYQLFTDDDEACRILFTCIDILRKYIQTIQLCIFLRGNGSLGFIIFFRNILCRKRSVRIWYQLIAASL